MARKRLLWQLFSSHLFIIMISLVALTWYTSRAVPRFYLKQKAEELEARARLLEGEVAERLVSGQTVAVDLLCKELGRKTATRITVILNSGRVIGDTEEDPAAMDNHAKRPEIMQALAGQKGISTRYSRTLGEKLMYVALPLKRGDDIIGVIRTSIPLTSINTILGEIRRNIALGGVVVAVLAAAMSLVMARRISRPLERMKEGAERFARGELVTRLAVPASEELGGLAQAMNEMASQLDERIRTAITQRSELEAVLSSMVEGVLAVDTEERLMSMNQAAGQLLGVNPEEVQGLAIQEVLRNSDLLRFVARALGSMCPVEGDIILGDESEKFLQAHGTILHDAEGRGIGALVVLNDVTRIRRLENVRREFVANVAHEIRTPVTSIKGFAETLLDGALSDQKNTRNFLRVIARQTDRLNAIIEDLLTLARIEEEAERAEIELKEQQIVGPLRAAMQICEREASAKGITIDLACNDSITGTINSILLEQAVANLIDNAIKYSEPKSSIHVGATQGNGEIIISVRDEGCGIPQEHLPRLFERFYRVDKARSRKLGGTGLGLAIVKHIIQAHGGRVTVTSTPGQGSTFTLYLPRLE
jgi:two-component system phosphate regulon sensor histidine kinase PhoR